MSSEPKQLINTGDVITILFPATHSLFLFATEEYRTFLNNRTAYKDSKPESQKHF